MPGELERLHGIEQRAREVLAEWEAPGGHVNDVYDAIDALRYILGYEWDSETKDWVLFEEEAS